jgi:hypothetical protein
MRKRTIAVAVLLAAGLSVVTTGAASADEPEPRRGPVIVTCEDGELVTREPTDEERDRLRARPVPPGRPHIEDGPRLRVEPDGRGEGHTRVLPDGGEVRVVPAEPGAPPPVTCDDPVPPRVERFEPAVPAPPR